MPQQGDKRILALSTVHDIGHPRYGMKIVRGLAREGLQVEAWARGRGGPPEEPNLQIRLLPPRGKVARMLDLPRALLRALRGGHDLVVVSPPETVPLGILAKLAGKRVLWDVEEEGRATILDSDWIPAPLRRPVASVYSTVERIAARTFNGISLAEESYRPRFRTARRVEVIHNYPPRPREQEQSTFAAASRVRWQRPGPRLVYAGSVQADRGLAEVIEAVGLLEKKLPELRLDIYGPIPHASHRRLLERRRADLRDPDRVRLHGAVPFQRLPELLAEAQVGLLPMYPTANYRFSEPTKMFEYALAGLVMVAGDIPAWSRLVVEADAGELATPADPGSWADAIARLWERGPEELRAAGERARSHVLRNDLFWEPEQRRLADLCHRILQEDPGR
jgi:glycosyltransferase involved in cell wall biosynthesis